MRLAFAVAGLTLLALPALAGPPYLSDDPEPTPYRNFEIYAFGGGIKSSDGMAGETGIDFNYGAAPDLQLTAVLPLAYDEAGRMGVGNVELAAKYLFLHQEDDGLDVSVFPRVFLSSATRNLGDGHAAFLLPIWVEKDFGKWSVFGGGGCTLNRGDDGQSFCEGGIALTREVIENLRLGLEVFHQGADTLGGKVSTTLGGGLTYDLGENYHLLGYWGPGLENRAQTGRYNWYSALLFTF